MRIKLKTKSRESTGETLSNKKKTVSRRKQFKKKPRFLSLKLKLPASRTAAKTSPTIPSNRSAQ